MTPTSTGQPGFASLGLTRAAIVFSFGLAVIVASLAVFVILIIISTRPVNILNVDERLGRGQPVRFELRLPMN